MKILLGYLDRAADLEKLAATEPNVAFRERLLKQASAYRELAVKRAKEFGFPPPSPLELIRYRLCKQTAPD
jgi:hypothetical protein